MNTTKYVLGESGLQRLSPRFCQILQDHHRTRHNAFLLESAGYDYVLEDERVQPLEVFLGDFLDRLGCELVVTFSLSEGIQIHQTEDGQGVGAEHRERRLRSLSGLRPWRGDDEPSVDGGAQRPALDEVMRGLNRLLRQAGTRAGVIMKHVERLFPDTNMPGILSSEQLAVEEIAESWGVAPEVRLTGNIVIALTQDAGRVGTSIRKAFVPLSEPLPDAHRIRRFLDVLKEVGTSTAAFGELEDGVAPEVFVNAAKGLPLRAIEDIFRDAGAKSTPVTLEAVRREKERVITQLADGALVPLTPLPGGFKALAGVDHVADDLREIGRLLKANPDSPRLPKAVLLLGPPGTGKTSVARALAWEAGGINVVSLGEIKASLVGESERRMDHALRLLTGMSPVICFVDEVDTFFVSRGEATGDSGTSKSILGKFLAALGDDQLRGKVLFVLASNRGDLLDAALLRRCSRVYLLSTPGLNDRAKILRALARRDGRPLADDVDLAAVAERTAGCSGADLEKILARAADIADRETGTDETPIAERQLAAAVADYKPNRDELLHTFFDLSALRTCPFLSGVPWFSPERGLDHPDCPPHVRQLLREDGSLDTGELNRRLSELSAAANRQIG